MDSPRTWHVIFTGVCYVIAAVIGAIVTYFLTMHFSKRMIDESPTSKQAGSIDSTFSPSDRENPVLQKKIVDLQSGLAAEQRTRAECEQQVSELESTKSSQKEKISKLELKGTEMQNELDTAKSRFAYEELQLKKLSSDTQSRLDRARTNFKAGRIRVFAAPDGSARTITIVYDERTADVVSPAVIARFRAGQ